MSALACFLWWLVLGALLGVIGSWLIGRKFKPTAVPAIDKSGAQPPRATAVAMPVDRIVEKFVDRPIEKIVERIVEKPVEHPNLVGRIQSLEAELAAGVALAAGLRSQLDQAPSTPAVKETVIEKIVEKIVDRPVEKIIEKIVEKPVDNPAHLVRIKALEAEVGQIGGLRGQLLALQSAPPRTVEKIVEKIVEKPIERVVEKLVPDPASVTTRDKEIADWRTRFGDLERRVAQQNTKLTHAEAEIGRLSRAPAIDLAAAQAAGLTLKHADDLEVIEGIGPKIAELLREGGIKTFVQLAQATPQQIRDILDNAGPNFRLADPATWQEQAELAGRNRWRALKSLQDVLVGGVRGDGSLTAQASEAHDKEIKALRAQLIERDTEIKHLKEGPPIDFAAAKDAGFNLKGPDDLEIIEGIGPKIAELLVADGVTNFIALARTTAVQIQSILDKAGPHFRLAQPDTWPEQADLAAHNRWRALGSLQKALIAGNREKP